MNKKTIGYVTLIVLLSIASLFSINLFLRERVAKDKLDIRTFPYLVGDWKGRDLEVKEYEYQILETRNLISREYTNPGNDRLYLFIIYSETNRSVFHPPEVCLIGSGLTIVDKEPEKMKFDKYEFLTNKLHLEKNNYKETVLYLYKAGRIYTENFYLQQFYLALNQVFGKRSPGATIRVSMPLMKDEKITLVTLKDFLAKTTQMMDSLG